MHRTFVAAGVKHIHHNILGYAFIYLTYFIYRFDVIIRNSSRNTGGILALESNKSEAYILQCAFSSALIINKIRLIIQDHYITWMRSRYIKYLQSARRRKLTRLLKSFSSFCSSKEKPPIWESSIWNNSNPIS